MTITNYGELDVTIDEKTGLARMRKPETVSAVLNEKQTLPPRYSSRLEMRYAQYLAVLEFSHEITRWWYQPMRFFLPGGVTYRPDFLIESTDGLAFHETKGWSQNLRDGMTRLKIAAGLFPCFTWCLVKKAKTGWIVKKAGG